MVLAEKSLERERPKFWAQWFKWLTVAYALIILLQIVVIYVNWPMPLNSAKFVTITGSVDSLRSRSPHLILKNTQGEMFGLDFPVFYDFFKPPGAPAFFVNDVLVQKKIWECKKLNLIVDDLMLISGIDYRIWGVACLSDSIVKRDEIEANWREGDRRRIIFNFIGHALVYLLFLTINYFSVRHALKKFDAAEALIGN